MGLLTLWLPALVVMGHAATLESPDSCINDQNARRTTVQLVMIVRNEGETIEVCSRNSPPV